MRILIVSHPPLSLEHGASQTALNLAAALRERGHDAVAWSPEPLPPRARWWNRWLWQRRRIEEHLESGAFDIVDLPAISVSRRIAARRSVSAVVARSVQPELRYLWLMIQDRARLFPGTPVRIAAEAATWPVVSRAVTAGWRRADVVLCLGTHELEWMRQRFPWVRPKLEVYLDAPPPADQEAFAAVRSARMEEGERPAAGLRFLWIGRWVPHKGIHRLVRFLAARAASHPQDSFTLAGCGGEAVRDCPPGLVRDGRLRIVPSFTRGELPGLLGEHDAGLFTSEVEGWGLSLNEMLEAGLPVFATRAGGVPDLAPCFPHSLRPFPPPETSDHPGPDRDLAATGYYDRFTWPRIAERYEATVLRRIAAGPLQRAGPCASSR